MVQVVLGVAVFVLAVAMIGLYAMMGELASRVPDPADQLPDPDSPPEPLAGARLGAEAAGDWPAELAEVPRAAVAHVVVFGASCHTCRQIASGATGPLDALSPPPSIVVSCSRPEVGAEFVAEHPMIAAYSYAIDVGGEWLQRNFDVGTSPAILVFTHGRLRSAHTFGAAPMLRNLPPVDLPTVGEPAPAR